MIHKLNIFISIILILNSQQALAQKFNVGFGVYPQISWFSSNDANVKSAGSSVGFGMGLSGEYELKHTWKLTSNIGLSFNQGGKITHEVGGNLWPEAVLKLPILNTGIKPIPDNSTLTYELKNWTVSAGIKKIISESEDSRFFIEIPKLNFSKIISARGAIMQEELLTNEENISEEAIPYLYGVSAAIGIENRIGRNAFWYSSLEFYQGLNDITRNNGYKALKVYDPDPSIITDDRYYIYPDKTKILLQTLSIKLGVLF